MNVCIKCSDKHSDFRSEAGHLTMDPTTGATILEPHGEPQTAIEADRDTAVLLRAIANEQRRIAFRAMESAWVLEPSGALANKHRLADRIAAFLPRAAYFTPTWTEEARRAFYGLPTASQGIARFATRPGE